MRTSEPQPQLSEPQPPAHAGNGQLLLLSLTDLQKVLAACGRPADAVKILAVSKTFSAQAIQEAYESGVRMFGENKIQELSGKVSQLPDDVQWHFIGHLQTNKLKIVLPYVSLVQSVDSERLLDAINAWGAANGKTIDVLLEPHVAAEETKQGFSPDEVMAVISNSGRYGNIRFRGIMGMATFTDDESVIRDDFSRLRDIYKKATGLDPDLSEYFTELSIGMSDDYPIAVEYGSTIVRIGSMIFGERTY